MTELINYINSIDIQAIIDSITSLFVWVLNTITSIFTNLSSILSYANNAVSSLISFMGSNSGFSTIFGQVWNILPSFYISLVILMITSAVVLIMIRRL